MISDSDAVKSFDKFMYANNAERSHTHTHTDADTDAYIGMGKKLRVTAIATVILCAHKHIGEKSEI